MRGRPFEPGNHYGRGRPPGSRNKVAGAAQQALEDSAEMLVKKCMHMAFGGDTVAMRLCLERLVPARRQRVLRFKLPAIKTAAELSVAYEAVVRAVSNGLLTPAEGQSFSLMLDGRRRVIETEELEARLRALESGSGAAPDRGAIALPNDSEEFDKRLTALEEQLNSASLNKEKP